jgi:hypothetical protein
MKDKKDIKIIYYSAEDEPSGEQLQRVIEMNFPKRNVEVCRSLTMLSQQLEQPSPELLIVVLLAADREELSGLMRLQELLLDRRVILVLPDNEPDTASWGHRLRPRFITYRSSDYNDVSVVLGRMNQS